jgi:hypothetical protein
MRCRHEAITQLKLEMRRAHILRRSHTRFRTCAAARTSGRPSQCPLPRCQWCSEMCQWCSEISVFQKCDMWCGGAVPRRCLAALALACIPVLRHSVTPVASRWHSTPSGAEELPRYIAQQQLLQPRLCPLAQHGCLSPPAVSARHWHVRSLTHY